ncbi:MAG: DUF6232 family protein [Bacteroidota bacterium]
MIPDKIIYTDGHDVTVTESTLKVKNASYRLNGITKLSLWRIRPERWPGIMMVLVGLIIAVCGALDMIPPDYNVTSGDRVISANTLAIAIGAALSLIGILITAMIRERYAVRIATAEGEKNAIVSYHREYIAQIIDAINKAFDFGQSPTYMAAKE